MTHRGATHHVSCMRALITLLAVLLASLPCISATIEIDLPELLGRYENGDSRAVPFFSIATPAGELLVGASLRLKGTTDCGPEGCDPFGNFWFGTYNVTVLEGSFEFEAPLGPFEPFPLFSIFPGRIIVFVGPPSGPPIGSGTGGGSMSFNGFFGASGAVFGLVEPRQSSPVIITSATLVLQTVPEPGVVLLAIAGLSLARARGRFPRR